MTLKINSTLFDELSTEIEEDFTALFNTIKEDVIDLQEKAIKNNWTAEQYIEALEILFE